MDELNYQSFEDLLAIEQEEQNRKKEQKEREELNTLEDALKPTGLPIQTKPTGIPSSILELAKKNQDLTENQKFKKVMVPTTVNLNKNNTEKFLPPSSFLNTQSSLVQPVNDPVVSNQSVDSISNQKPFVSTKLTNNSLSKSTNDFKNKESSVDYYKNLMEQYNTLQKNSQEATLAASLGEAGETIAYALARAKKPESDFYKNLAQSGEKNLKEFKEKTDFELEARKNDSNSPESKSAQNFAKSLGYPVTGKESYNELKERFPIMERFQSAKDNREALALNKAILLNEKNEAKIEKEANRLVTNQPYSEQNAALEALKTAENKIGSFINDPNFSFETFNKNKFKKDIPGVSVPGMGRVTWYSSNARELNTAFQNVLNQAIRAFAGKAVTKNELERIKAQYEAGEFANEKDFLQAFSDTRKAVRKGLIRTEQGFNPKALDLLEERGATIQSRQPTEDDSSNVKEQKTIKLKEKVPGKAGKRFTHPKNGKMYVVNPDEMTATEI